MLLVVAVLAWYVLAWLLVGRDPPARPVVVRYEPPEGLSPAATGYLHERGYSPRQFTAALMSLSRKGVLEMEESRAGWTVRRTGALPAKPPPEERVLVETLLPDDDAVVITGISNRRFRAARRALRRELRRRYHARFFATHRGWVVSGVALSLAGLAAAYGGPSGGLDGEVGALAGAVLVWGFVTTLLLTRGYRRWRLDLAEMSPAPSLAAASVLPLLSLIPLGILGAMALQLHRAVPVSLLLTVLALAGLHALFHELLQRPTVAGRDFLAQVEGFRLYLSTTDADRVARLSSEEAQDLHERLLPYSIALGLRNHWAAVFGDMAHPLMPH